MATTFEVVLPYGTPEATSLAGAVFDVIDRLEDQLTVYREHSEVSRLNRRAHLEVVPVERGLFELLSLSAQLNRDTAGAFDVTAGALSIAWGFHRGPRRVPADAERAEALRRVGSQHLQLDREAETVRFLCPGLAINLGSIGKGYALDRAALLMREERGVASALLHGGTSSVLALGSEPGSRHGWRVGVRHPWDPERRLATVRLRDRALGTSAATFQYLEHEGRKLGHILDPRTGWPAVGMASATAIAPTAALADALATAFFILGVDQARAYCEQHPEVGAVLLPDQADVPVILGPDAIE